MATFQMPTEGQVREALRRIPTSQLRRAFFEGLKNPLWVEPLAKEGVFNNPPEPEVTDDGLIRDVYWPEINYLVRVAPDEPKAVVDVLLKLRKSTNAWVRRGVFTIGATVPADQTARLKPLIRSWKSSDFGWRTDPRELVDFAVNLLRGGQYEVGKWFASLIFKPSAAQDRRKPSLVLEDYWYEEGLPKVAAVLGDDGVNVVLPWLVAYERHIGHLTKDSDMTYFSRESIRSRGDSHDTVERVLIDSVRDLAIKSTLVDAPSTVQILLATKMLLARKIALFALAEVIKQTGDDPARTDLHASVARELLFSEASIEDACRIEYAELARAVAEISPAALDPLTQYIELGPRVDGDRLRQWLRGEDDDDGAVDERVQEYTDRWKHRWLSSIGTRALPASLQAILAELDSRYGVIDAPLEPAKRVTTWTGPNSPLSQDDMAAMSPTELVSHLESWHDAGDGWGPEPSHEGQGRELTALLTTNPMAVTGIDNLIQRLRPTYLRAIVRGWEAGLKADLALDWQLVADVIAGVLGHSDESSFPAEGGQWDDDANFRAAKQAAVGLLEEIVKTRSSPTIPAGVMSRYADMVITLSADATAWDEYISYEGEGDMDPLTLSLNWQWPIRVRALTHLMSHGSETTWYAAARMALDVELSRQDARGASSAVVGEGLGRLLNVDPEWLEPKISKLFGSELGLSVEQQIALTAAMSIHRYHSKLYDLLAPSMVAAIRSKEPIVAGWRTQSDPLQRIGEWVIEALIYGHKTLDDPVAQEFFTTATPKIRGDAIGHIAWAFMHAQIVEDPIRDWFAELWDARVAHVRAHPEDKEELDGFSWFVKSGKFEAEWWLPRLKEAAELDPGLSTERYMIGKELAAAADADPRAAFDSLRLLLARRDEAGMVSFDLTRHAVPMVIARAIASGDDGLRQEAVDYMNQLGEQGNLSLEAEVNQVLDGRITQSDVED